MTVLEMARVDRLTQKYDLAVLFPNLSGPFASAGVALLPRRVRPNGSTVFQSLTIAAGKVTVTFAGPDASSSGAVVVTGSGDAHIEVTTSDGQVDTAKALIVTLIGGGTVPSLPGTSVASVNGKSGTVTLTAADVGADAAGAATAAQAAATLYASTGLAGKQDKATLGADVAADATVRAAYASKAGGNVFVGPQRLSNAPVAWDDAQVTRQPFASIQTIDAVVAGSADKVGHVLHTAFTGNMGAGTGSNPAFGFGINVFTVTGLSAGDGAGGNITNIIESAAAAPSGTVDVLQGLLVQAAFFGAAAGGHVNQMESLRVAAPARKDGATAGTATNVYGLFIEDVEAAAVGATGAALSLFVAGGVSRFGGRVDVDGTIAATNTGGLNLLGVLGAPSASMVLNNVSTGGGHAQIKLGASGSVFAVTSSGGVNVLLMDGSGNTNLKGGIGLFGTSAVTSKPTVSGSRGGNAALDSLLNTLAGYGLITNSTTA